ncbi:MAG: pilin [Minisyncoccia bacterium]|jgi:hypothetical protein
MKKFFLFPFLFFLLVAPGFAFAQTVINAGLPGVGPVTPTTSPGTFVESFYVFALMIGGVLAFGAVVYGGVLYAISAGNPGKQSEGKEWIKSAIYGLLLLAGAYLVLYTINPNLVNLNLPTLGAINIQAPSGGTGGATNGSSVSGGGSGTCAPTPSGPCSVAQLSQTCMGNNAQAASEICAAESSGNAVAGGDLSTNGQPVSIGLFQINLSANNLPGLNCTAAFNHTWMPNNPSTIVNAPLYNQCLAAAQNIAINTTYACTLSNKGQGAGTSWGAWSTHTGCGL